MRLILEFTQKGDGYESGDCYYTVPAEYESAEAFLVDFETKLKDIVERFEEAKSKMSWDTAKKGNPEWDHYCEVSTEIQLGFCLGGQRWYPHFFYDGVYGYTKEPIILPRVYELSEWWETRMREERPD